MTQNKNYFFGGLKSEDFVLNLLLEDNALIVKPIGKFVEYDFECIHPLIKCTLEVKYDKKSSLTKNIAIEIYNPLAGKESGIAVTKADFWCIMLPKQQLYFCPTIKLKHFIVNTPEKKMVFGGDSNSIMLLYQKTEILKIFNQYIPGKSFIEQLKDMRNAL